MGGNFMIRRIGMMAATALLAMAGAFAQTSSIEGDVKGEDGKAYAGQDKKADYVEIERTDIKGNYKTHVDKKGHYFHAGLPLGTYNIRLFIGGKMVDQVSGVRTRLGDPTPIHFDMAAQAAKNKAMQQAAQTGQLTDEMKRDMSPEARAAIEKQMQEQQAKMAKNKALNDAFNAGMTAMQAQQWQEAITQLTKASELDATQLAVWSNLAAAYDGLGKTAKGPEQEAAQAKAGETYQKVIEMKPDDAAIHNNYGLLLARMKKFKESEEELAKAAALDPPGAGKYYYNLGAILINTGQNEPAGEAFKKAIAADPNYADAHYQYGIYLTGKAQVASDGSMTFPPGTRESFEKYLELKPEGPFAESAKSMVATMGAKVETQYSNPAAQPAKKSSKNKQ
jgi:tetratricopeptide (TPR) repeat protein